MPARPGWRGFQLPKHECPWSKGNEALLATLEEIELPERLVMVMKRENVRLVGEFVQLTQPEILQRRGLGAKSLQVAVGILSGLGFSTGMALDGWYTERALEARRKMGRQLQTRLFGLGRPEWSEHRSLESELLALLLEATHERNAEMLSLLYGFNEHGPRTLESTGRRYGLTRERVRQIAAKVESRLASVWRPTRHLFIARDLINSDLARPFSAAEFSEAARKAGITEIAFHVGGAIRAIELVGEPSAIESFRVGGTMLYGDRSDRRFLETVLNQVRKDTTARGCVEIGRLAQLLGSVDAKPDEIRRLLSGFDEIAWLDEQKTWLMSTAVSRNRLVNVTSGILSALTSLDIKSLHASLQRPRRIKLVPPQSVLAAFLEVNGIARVKDGRAHVLADATERELGLNDKAFIKALRELGSPVAREELEEYCVERLGVNVRSFYVNLSYSPLVVKVAPGVFSLLGEPVDPERVERLRSRAGRDRNGNSE